MSPPIIFHIIWILHKLYDPSLRYALTLQMRSKWTNTQLDTPRMQVCLLKSNSRLFRRIRLRLGQHKIHHEETNCGAGLHLSWLSQNLLKTQERGGCIQSHWNQDG